MPVSGMANRREFTAAGTASLGGDPDHGHDCTCALVADSTNATRLTPLHAITRLPWRSPSCCG